MIARLTGQVLEQEAKALIVDVQGIGYRVMVLKTLHEKAQVGAVVNLYTHHQVTDESQALYGFISREELQFFELLLIVPSVGPRTAMSILEIAPPATLAQAVHNNDTVLLTRVSGIGRKTAERIVVELRGKLPQLAGAGVAGRIQHETITALTGIGYSPAVARELVKKLPSDITSVEAAVRAVLKEKVAHNAR
ncbi:MAG: Holliday junction branch migration protein RuvA [Candidatus Andersenbacteria bacterium]